MPDSLKIRYYKVALLSIKRSGKGGVFVNAKPILLLAFFDLISHGRVNDNKFYFNPDLIQIYKNIHQLYEPNKNITPCEYPFYHLRNDGFVTLALVDNYQTLPHTPSAKYLRENVKYASLDNALWDLLQDVDARNILLNTVISHFLTNSNDKPL